MLKRAGINKQLISGLDAVGRGYYGFGPDLEPNGFLVDAGVDKVSTVIPEPSKERMLAAGRAAVEHMHALGITAWLDPAASEAILEIYRGLAESGELNSHVVALAVIEFKKGHPADLAIHGVTVRLRFSPRVRCGKIAGNSLSSIVTRRPSATDAQYGGRFFAELPLREGGGCSEQRELRPHEQRGGWHKRPP